MRTLASFKRLSGPISIAAGAVAPSSSAKPLASTLLSSSSVSRNSAAASSLLRPPWSIIQQRGVKVDGSEVRPGNVIERKGRLYEVIKAEHNQQGRGSAVIQAELRDVESGNKVNARFNTDESVEKIFVGEKFFTCMCTIGDEVALIDPNTFEQLDVKKDLFGKNAMYLKEEMKVILRLFDGKPLSGLVPKRVVCTVAETPPPTKGGSSASSEKKALLENGLTLKVPTFIETGEAILVNTDDGSYISRAKEWHTS